MDTPERMMSVVPLGISAEAARVSLADERNTVTSVILDDAFNT
jgi:hypothetical protein